MNGHSAHTPARLAFRVLGPLEVDGPDGRPVDVCGGKPATMLALLLLHRNAWVSTDQLIEAVWAGCDTPASAQRNLKTYVWQLRRALPEERIESRPGAYRVLVGAGELDADDAAALADRADKLLRRIRSGQGEPTPAATRAAELIDRALRLWRGCPYEGLTGDASSAVERLTELHRSLREDLAEAQLVLGRSAEAISGLKAITEEDPLRELAWTRLMRALRSTGRRHEALAAYQRARSVLIRELGIEPSAELTALHQQLLADETTPANPAAPVPAESTLPVWSDLPPRLAGFVGREAELRLLTEPGAADRVRVVTVDGMPGIGKTALVLEAAARIGGVDALVHLDLRTHRSDSLTATDALGELLSAVRPDLKLPSTTAARAACWRSLGLRVVLVLDDVADAGQVRALLPNTPGSVVLVTSRGRLSGLDRDLAVTLDAFDQVTAQRLTDSEQILHWSAGHPGVLRLLTERIHGLPPWTAARITAGLDDRTTRLRELADVHTSFDQTYLALPDPVRRLYRLLALTPAFDVRRAARLAGAEPTEVEPMVDALLNLHLVTEPAPGRFSVHPVVRDHAYRWLTTVESPADVTAAADRIRIPAGTRLELVSPDDPRVA
ncbi:DNA-binding SARP family transcriptional activator [Kribbella amoyensis]|uniref:DNA-binding SARP family transcriptional activator n=1 Tax=Kribbella amoyensis TaxID=996641 RepID=A0A561BQZ6_9ACTN|nr:BTAD domain-containing putative transcriptional regulator [Kribbella amoyensis]TWD81307.1 DNA-binding SARP family transcriptional activator [Kribbella amoyensis]